VVVSASDRNVSLGLRPMLRQPGRVGPTDSLACRRKPGAQGEAAGVGEVAGYRLKFQVEHPHTRRRFCRHLHLYPKPLTPIQDSSYGLIDLILIRQSSRLSSFALLGASHIHLVAAQAGWGPFPSAHRPNRA